MNKLNLKEAVKSFIEYTCAELRYDENKTLVEKKNNIYLGKSLKENQIPYNMQMDIDRMCLKNALDRFLDSGRKEDAFDIYFSYIEMYIGEYGKSRRMIELLSEFENNGSSLLMKHRDHYSHSAYVFALGLAIYETNSDYRKIYAKNYSLVENSIEAAHHYLKYWGLTALFHDIGYPLELPFEQVSSYYEVDDKKRSIMPYISYNNLDDYASDLPEILAKNIYEKLGKYFEFTDEYILNIINDKPRHPENYGFFMDHAYFSSTILYRRVFLELGKSLSGEDVDCLSAIILHNSMFKFCIGHYKTDKSIPMKCELMPLAYMLMLCDELQCWDRTAYGRNTRKQIYPMDCELEFANNSIFANYIYNSKYRFQESSLKDTSPGKEKFDTELAQIFDIELVNLKSSFDWKESEKNRKHSYLSSSNFLNLYNFAVSLNGRYNCLDEWKIAKEQHNEKTFLIGKQNEFQDDFDKLSLEYKLSNINQAKAFDFYLNEIDAFYSDKLVDFEELESFSKEEIAIIAPLEHKRWLQEHISMGWRYGLYSGNERELKRLHKDMIEDVFLVDGKLTDDAARLHYNKLSAFDQEKDIEPMNVMLELLRIFDGVKIYRLK